MSGPIGPQLNPGFQNKTEKGTAPPRFHPCLRGEILRGSQGPACTGWVPESASSTGSLVVLMLPILERFEHRLLEGLSARASGAHLLGVSTSGETEAQSGQGTSPMSPSESEMSQNQIPRVPVTVFIAW